MNIYFTDGRHDVPERRAAELICPTGGLIVKIPRDARGAAAMLFEMLRPDYAIINAKSPAAQLHRDRMIFLDGAGAVEAGVTRNGGPTLGLLSGPDAGKIIAENYEEKNKKNSDIPQPVASQILVDGKTP
jgi:hypothetical protein